MNPAEDAPPPGLSAQIASLSQVLRRYATLRVPRYQRGYSWTSEEVSRLLQDVRLAVSRNAPYYFVGPIVLVRTAEEGQADIVDGQQRLATLTMLLAYLRDVAEVRDQAAWLQKLIAPRKDAGLQLRSQEADFFRLHVQQQGGAAKLASLRNPGSDAEILLAAAAETLAEGLAGFTEAERGALARFLTERVVFSVMESEDLEGASLLFRVLNNRGRDLSDAAIIKSELLEAANLSDEEADAAAQHWDRMEERIGREQFEKLLDMAPLIISGNTRESPGDLAAFRRDVLEFVDAAQFLQGDLARYGAALEALARRRLDLPPEAAGEVGRRLICLGMVKNRFWLPAATAYMADHLDDPAEAVRFFAGIERLAFVCTLGVIRPERRFERFAQVVRARGRANLLFGPSGVLELTEGERRQTIKRLNEPFQRDHSLRRLVAFRVSAALGDPLELSSPFTVEHVLPARPSARAWVAAFPDPADREVLAHLIGNWAIVSPGENSEAADKTFSEKREIFFRRGDAAVRAMTRDVRAYPDWTPTVVRLRHEKLVAQLCADWALVGRAS